MANNAPAGNDKSAQDSKNAVPQPALSVYKHGVEVAVKGNYLDLLPYLDKLQKYPKRLFWGDAKLNVAAYPEVVFTVVIYTLSEQSGSPLG
jgi:MSHA biogenesis protein MshJ